MREDLELQNKAIELGWTVDLHINDKNHSNTPNFPLSFSRSNPNKVIWKTRTGWTCADITSAPEHYFNHRVHKTLALALEIESK